MIHPAKTLATRLNGVHDHVNQLQLNFAFGALLMALEEAAVAGVTLTSEHLTQITEIRTLAARGYSNTLGFSYDLHASKRDGKDALVWLPLEGFVPRAESMLEQLPYTTDTVADVYDDNPVVSEVLTTLFPDFEFPEFSHLSIDQVRRQYALKKSTRAVKAAWKLSDCVDSMHDDVSRMQRQLRDMGDSFPTWKRRTVEVDGLLACGLTALQNIADEMRQTER